ncbi:MepB domain containing protein [Arthrobacter sp. ERGS1:01]|uniref:MepB family protein n=1 Tax=Arthrobacter sp. ERGS1:01 TaxID=1704044 RepID=UPI0006B4045A|nr:MepB family protein [Arthrobacter sp. ERGS1:01]ALE06161.1 MepB domain containing protein [Arthrobacter sp. ERGS1:01]
MAKAPGPAGILPGFLAAKSRVFDPAGLDCADVVPEPESSDYCAHILTLGGRSAVFRAAKTTPTKAGHFVTLWLRSAAGPIRPFDADDGVEQFIVSVTDGERHGLFVFPAPELAARGVMSVDGKGGKRAIRVYAPWVQTSSAQAARTQAWQLRHFLHVDPVPVDLVLAKELFAA